MESDHNAPELGSTFFRLIKRQGLPAEARKAFGYVASCLYFQVEALEETARNPMLGERYAWEQATKFGDKPGDSNVSTLRLIQWLREAEEAGIENAQELVEGHAEYQELVKRLDYYRGWGDQPAFILKLQPNRQPEPARFANLPARQTKLLSGLNCLAGQRDLFQTDGE